ncbi:MlaC/ttg2D family ABC transporter substrate-binding protein [Albidovulum sediminis]|uniref:ABC transporter substrate-binding protein n=1 Tax=Albidovulum sediminis TaxID=3066345 RepID=A0ABT2NM90_9RHOB|nr:ABC transporter substrate-binding protein [Defluviimonas sediminis]MCT8330038.1 ABC transporter substrate-binding protein [Defluviimonas sediminis]
MAADRLSRRRALTIAAGGIALAATGLPAAALNVDEARALVGRLVGDINAVIASGKSEGAMIKDFERIFARYADVRYIAQSALGPAGRSAAKSDVAAYTAAFQGYIARKYGKRFREFIGGEIEVTDAHPLKSFFEVVSIARLKGQSPFDVRWHVFDKSGKDLFFNIIIEGVNMLATERTEIGAMLDQAKGSIPALTAALKKAG